MQIQASPSTKHYAANKGVDLEALAKATGRTTLGREDVDAHLGSNAPAASAPDASRYWTVDHAAYGPVTEQPMSRIAQIASANLSAANSMIPQVTHHDRADMRAVEAFRKTLKEEGAARGVKITALAFHVMALARLADPSAETEAPRLIPSAPLLRPADVLASVALVGCLAALDVGASSPEAQGAGEGCCNAMHAQKLDEYRGHLTELAAAGHAHACL
jgi:hypothetical protein